MGLRCRAWAVLVAAAAVVSMAWARPAAAQRPIKRVLTIHAGPESFPGNTRFDEVITKVLYSHPTIEVDYYAEFLEYEEFGVAADTSLREYIRMKFRDRPLDALIADGAPAVQFALQHRAELFPDVPIVFVSATTPREVLEGKVARVTGVLRGTSHVETLDLALKLHPATRRIQVVAYAPNFASYQESVKSALAAFSTRVTLTYSNEPSFPEMLAALKTLPADSLILYARYSPATRGRVIFPDELLPEVAEAAPVPIYSPSRHVHRQGRGRRHDAQRSQYRHARWRDDTIGSSKGRNRKTFPSKPRACRRSLTGGRCNGGASSRRCCRSPVSSCFASQASGTATVGTSSVQ